MQYWGHIYAKKRSIRCSSEIQIYLEILYFIWQSYPWGVLFRLHSRVACILFYCLWVCLPSHFPMTTFLLPPIPQRCLQSLLLSYFGMCFLAFQSSPRIYLHLAYLNHQISFFHSFSWDASRTSEQQGFFAVKGGYKCKHIQEPIGNINVWNRTSDVQQRMVESVSNSRVQALPKDISKRFINHCAGQTKPICSANVLSSCVSRFKAKYFPKSFPWNT